MTRSLYRGAMLVAALLLVGSGILAAFWLGSPLPVLLGVAAVAMLAALHGQTRLLLRDAERRAAAERSRAAALEARETRLHASIDALGERIQERDRVLDALAARRFDAIERILASTEAILIAELDELRMEIEASTRRAVDDASGLVRDTDASADQQLRAAVGALERTASQLEGRDAKDEQRFGRIRAAIAEGFRATRVELEQLPQASEQ